jgi:hypothetical protein
MPVHIDGLKCIGRALLLPKSPLKTLHLDEIYAYGSTMVPTYLHGPNPKHKSDGSFDNISTASHGNLPKTASGAFDYKAIKLKPNLASKFKSSEKKKARKDARSVPGYQDWHKSSDQLEDVVAALLPFIQRAHSLVTLSIRRPNPPLFKDDSDLSDALVTCLYVNSSIQRLYLEGNAIGAKGVTSLLRSSNGRRRRCALQELGLRDQHPIIPITIM